jgi:hypothetical protein
MRRAFQGPQGPRLTLKPNLAAEEHDRPAGALRMGHQGASLKPQLIPSGLWRARHKI